MEIENIKRLLIEISHISKFHERISKISGENFNLFKVLKLDSSEVRLHSALIAELLDPKGSHGQEDKFLTIFLNQLGINEFETSTALVEVEKSIGPINSDYSEGGRIDIFLTDANKKRIMIENKINAVDQESQLCRYKEFDAQANLFYLNLFGEKPNVKSTKSAKIILSENDYKIISYSVNIIQWLEECKKDAVSLPIIRETITQYINLIKLLTNQSIIEKMQEEIKKLILENPDYFNSMKICAQTWTEITNQVSSKFKDAVIKEFHDNSIILKNGLTIRISCSEDNEGVWFGYKLFKGDEHLTDKNNEKLIITDLFKRITKDNYSNRNWIGWFFPKPFEKNKKLKDNSNEVMKILEDDTYIYDLVRGLCDREKEAREEFKNILVDNKLL